MASNAPARKPSNVISSRISYKPLKLETPQLSRTFQQPTIVSVNAKDANKDKDKDKKLKLPVRRASSNPKQLIKPRGPEATDQMRTAAAPAAAAAATAAPPPAMVPSTLAKGPTNERTVVLARHVDQVQQVKPGRKPRLDEPVSKARVQRGSPAPEAAFVPMKNAKEAKSKDKEAAAQRQIRTKNQSHNTKVFFDKYLKFAYDLSTPDGVRQLEAHFFPTEPYQNKQARKKSESGDFSEKQHSPDDKFLGMGSHVDQILQ